MKHLARIIAAVFLASSLLAGGEALAQGKGRDKDRGGRGWERSEREWRGGGRWDREDRGERDRGGRWSDGPPDFYGPPGQARRAPPPGYGIRRGGQLPPQFRGGEVPDYDRHRLRPPPPGFAWVRMGNRYALVSRATGQIFDVIGD